MPSQPTVYLVSGTSRGIGTSLSPPSPFHIHIPPKLTYPTPGLGFIHALASRPHTLIFAGARTPSSSPDLQALAGAHPGKVHIVELTAGDAEGDKKAAERIGEVAGRVDVVIANAGACFTVVMVGDVCG